MIVNVGKNHWVILSHEGKTLGEFTSKAEAEKRLKQIEYFKNKDKVKK